MSASSFGSYEGRAPFEYGAPYEYGRDPDYSSADPAALPGPAWPTDVVPAPTGHGGAPGGLAVSHATDWRMAVDDLGRPIPPPPGYASPPAPAVPQPPTTLLPTLPFSSPEPPPGPFAAPVTPVAWSASGSPTYQDALSHQPPPGSLTGPERSPFEVTTTAGPNPDGFSSTPPGGYAPLGPASAVDVAGVVTSSPYGSLPGVSLPTGAFVPASVPVPAGDVGPGLTALDDGVIDVDVPARAWEQPSGSSQPTGSRSGEPVGPPGSRRSDHAPPSRPAHAAVPPSDWDVVVDDGLAIRGPSTGAAVLAGPTPGVLPPALADLAAAAAAALQAVADRGDTGVEVGAPSGPVPLEPYQGERRVSPEDLAARHLVVREQVDLAMAEIALAKAAFRRACEDAGRPGWPFRDTELDLMRRPAVAHALSCELAGVERLRVWAQELYWLQEQNRGFA